MLKRLLKPIVDVRDEELATMVLMFAYSFLVMTSWNILKPITRSKFISDLGADNLPYITLAAGVIIGFIMQGFSKAIALLPRKWVIPVTQAGIATGLVLFWAAFTSGAAWAPAVFYLFGLIMSVLLISQFWTLANDIFDPRQAKRLFGFIGGGASLGGIMGSTILQFTERVGTNNLLLVSATILVICIGIVFSILAKRKDAPLSDLSAAVEEKGVSGGDALRLLRSSKHLQIIALVIGFAAMGAYVIEQQLNMAVEEHVEAQADGALKATLASAAAAGASAEQRDEMAKAAAKQVTDQITKVLGAVQLWTSILGFVIQVWLTSKIQRYLGVGFALLLLPMSLGSSAVLILLTGMLWSTQVARVLDTSLRYTVDKTTREILFLPLPTELKYQAKPFVDVTVDRFAKGLGGLLSLVLIKPWGLELTWRQMSVASLVLCGTWIAVAVFAKRGYVRKWQEALVRQDVEVADVRIQAADLSTIETLIGELSQPDEQRVLYAIGVLESLDKRNLITPLLLYHESPKVKARALAALSQASPELAKSWQPLVQRLLSDPDVDVRVAAMQALAAVREEDLADLVSPYLDHPDPRVVSTAAAVLARSQAPDNVARAEAAIAKLAGETHDAGAAGRREAAAAIRQIRSDRFNALLIPLLYDDDPGVAEEAMRSVQELGTANYIFVPTLVSLLGNRRLKRAAREVLVRYGEDVVDSLAYFLRDPDEGIWVRRHLPATLARIPCQRTLDALVGAIATETDGFVRYKLVTAIDRVLEEAPSLTFDRKPIETLTLRDSRRYFECLSYHHNLFAREKVDASALLARVLSEKMSRVSERLWLLLGLQYPRKDVAAARWAIERGDVKARSAGLEYLDNVIAGPFRKQLLPIFEDMPAEERVSKANSVLGTRPRGVEETLLALINDTDEIVAAAAIHLAARLQLWGLADDIEHVLAHRDVRDFFVFESASWALAEHRMPAERRRDLWLENLPAIEVAERLSQSPLFSRTSVDELCRLAGSGKQVRYESGRVLYSAGVRADTIQFLLDGLIEATEEGQTGQLAPPAALAFDEVVRGVPLAATLRTSDKSVCLSLTLEETRTLFAESTDLVRGLFATLLEHPAFAGRRVLVHGQDGAELARFTAEGIKPVEKVLALQRVDLFRRFPTTELLELANVARALPLKQDASLFGEGDAPAMYFVLDGEIALMEATSPPVSAAAGDAIGLVETLAGVPLGRTARVARTGWALKVTHEDLFDLLGHQPDLLRHLFGALLGARREVGEEAKA